MEDKEVLCALAALGHELRLRVFRMLVVAGLVTQERDGRSLIYRAAYDRMSAVLGFLTENCCQGQACLEPGPDSCKC